jgi:hypothetical protein
MTVDDGFCLNVVVNRDAYLYVVAVQADGSLLTLFPTCWEGGASALLLKGRDYRIPSNGQWFQLNSTPGEELLYLIADERKPMDVDAALALARNGANEEARKALNAALEKRDCEPLSQPSCPARVYDPASGHKLACKDLIIASRHPDCGIVQLLQIDHY